MKYRVILKVGYNEAYFEFDDINRAAEFAGEILVHSVKSDDTDKKTSVSIIAILDEESKDGEDL